MPAMPTQPLNDLELSKNELEYKYVLNVEFLWDFGPSKLRLFVSGLIKRSESGGCHPSASAVDRPERRSWFLPLQRVVAGAKQPG